MDERWSRRARAFGAEAACYLILVATVLVANGYAFGLYDHAIHLPWLLRRLDPGFLRGDPLVEAARYHPSLFWALQAPLVRALPIEALYLGLHLASIALMISGTRALARALHPGAAGRWAALLAPLLVTFAHSTAAAIPSMDALVLNRTVALGPLLHALALSARRRHHAAFAVIGLSFLVHPTTATHAAVLAGMVLLSGAKDPEERRALLTAPLVGLACASPLLAVMLAERSAAGVPFPPPEVWIKNTLYTTYFHHYPSFWTWNYWIRPALPLLVLAGSLSYRRSRPTLAMVAGVLLCCAVEGILVERFHVPSALHLHLLEASRFLTFIAAAHGAGWIVERWRTPPRSVLARAGVTVAALGFGLNTGPNVPGLIEARMTHPVAIALVLAGVALDLAARRRAPRREAPEPWPPPPWAAPAAAAACAALAAGLMLTGLRARGLNVAFDELYRHPGVCAEHLAYQQGARPPQDRASCGVAVMDWAARSLPEGAVVATPPYFNHPLVALRYRARRAMVGTWKDGSEGSFSVAFAAAWEERMEAITGIPDLLDLPLDQLTTDHIERTRAATLAGYRRADAARFRELAARFGATHAVVEVGAPAPDLPLVYEDAFYRVYRVEGGAAAAGDGAQRH